MSQRLTPRPVHRRLDKVIHIRSVVGDDLAGIPIYEALQFALKGVLATQRYHVVYFEEGGQVAGYFKHPNKLSEDQVKDLIRSWRRLSVGMARAYQVGVARWSGVPTRYQFRCRRRTSCRSQVIDC